MKIETSAHPIIGYRAWDWDRERGRLIGPDSNVAWNPGTTIASCLISPATAAGGHDAPDPNCSCGLYADYRPPEADDAWYEIARSRFHRSRSSSRGFLGAIALEGRVCVHECGLRGQRARIVVLAYQPTQRALVAEIAALYGTEAVPVSQLRQTAARFGVELPPPAPSDDELEPSDFEFEVPAGTFMPRSMAHEFPWQPLELDVLTSSLERCYVVCSACGRLFMTREALRKHRSATCGTDRHGGRVRRARRRK